MSQRHLEILTAFKAGMAAKATEDALNHAQTPAEAGPPEDPRNENLPSPRR